MRRAWIVAVAVSLACLALPALAGAATIGFAPTVQSAQVGDAFSVDIVVSNLGGEIVSAWDFDVTWDATVLTATSVSFGSLLGDPTLFEVLESSDLATAGAAGLAQLSLLSDASLLALQSGDTFVLATLDFTATAAGTSPLGFGGARDVIGSNGTPLVTSFGRGSVSVTAIPEPTAALTFAVGALLVGSRLRRRPAPRHA